VNDEQKTLQEDPGKKETALDDEVQEIPPDGRDPGARGRSSMTTKTRCPSTFPHDGVRLGCLLERGHALRHKTKWVMSGSGGLVQFWIWWKELHKSAVKSR